MTMIQDISEFYNINKAIVKGYPPQYVGPDAPEMTALRLNTFAVVRSVKDFSADNLNKRPQYQDSPYFFSRQFANSGYTTGNFKTEYPILAFAEDNIVFNFRKADVLKLNIILVDQIPQAGDFYTDVYSKHRELEDVARDIRHHFKKLIAIWREWIYAILLTPNANGWYDKRFLDNQNIPYTEECRLTDFVNVDSLQIEIFPSVIDGCLVGLGNITVQMDNCVVGVPLPNYNLGNDTEIYNQTKN